MFSFGEDLRGAEYGSEVGKERRQSIVGFKIARHANRSSRLAA